MLFLVLKYKPPPPPSIHWWVRQRDNQQIAWNELKEGRTVGRGTHTTVVHGKSFRTNYRPTSAIPRKKTSEKSGSNLRHHIAEPIGSTMLYWPVLIASQPIPKGKLHSKITRFDLIDFLFFHRIRWRRSEVEVWTGKRSNKAKNWVARASVCDASGATPQSCKATRAILNVHD